MGKSKAVDGLKVSTKGLEKEGFSIRTVKGNLVLLGYDDAGTQFAVYTFWKIILVFAGFGPASLEKLCL